MYFKVELELRRNASCLKNYRVLKSTDSCSFIIIIFVLFTFKVQRFEKRKQLGKSSPTFCGAFLRQLSAVLFSVWTSYFITVGFIATWNFNNLFARDKKEKWHGGTIVEKRDAFVKRSWFLQINSTLEIKCKEIRPIKSRG